MLEVDKNTFQTEVLEADGYVFVDFFGDGCVPCAALMPKVHEFADTYGDKSTSFGNWSEDSWPSGYGYLQRWRESR